MNTIAIHEIVDTLKPLNNVYFHIDDLTEYANKISEFGKASVSRNSNSELISYVLYYDNGPEIFISMVWTNPKDQGKGLAKKLITELINVSHKDVRLEVNRNNPAKYLYDSLKFEIESENKENVFMRYHKRLSIMQPYIFPYLGFFHLIEATDRIVFYDDVNYIKRGWINRNRILLNKTDYLFTIPVEKASQNKLINEIIPLMDIKFIEKFFAQIESAYKKAPHYAEVKELLSVVLCQKYESIADLAINSIVSTYDYLGKEIKWTKSSVCSPNSKDMDKADRLIQITKDLNYKSYVNAIGGQELYNKEYFNKHGVQLDFVQSDKIEYKQFDNDFIQWLSIIDLLMFNDKEAIKKQFSKYSLV